MLGKRALQGLSIPTTQISFVRSTPAGPRQFMTVTLQSSTVTHWELGGDEEPARLLRFDLNPSAVDVAYRPVDAQGGLGAEVKFGFSRSGSKVS